ncbi:abortive infection family protein [Aquimarina macrocephali]|uniref:abortive infection family protein n=1 Tax=Aquimarina macrocephali TaxID=666563 RepID=UPI0004643EA8|nr:abortive infection family protein [Aquimarina macrocephali]
MNDELFSKVEEFQNLLITSATGGDWDEILHKKIRDSLLKEIVIKDRLPEMVRKNRTLKQFWPFIQEKGGYADRRQYIWNEFSDLLEFLENYNNTPGESIISTKLNSISKGFIKNEWEKALKRKVTDPEGAITSSRTLLETVCKQILDELNESYNDKADLPILYKLTAKKLNLAPDQHTEQIFKQILSGCISVVSGLGSLRNKLSDAHGSKMNSVKPSERHAELAVNIAGTMTVFLYDTYLERIKT